MRAGGRRSQDLGKHSSYTQVGRSPLEDGTRIQHHGALKLVEIAMGKYLLGWVLGVPAIVLVVAYFFFH